MSSQSVCRKAESQDFLQFPTYIKICVNQVELLYIPRSGSGSKLLRFKALLAPVEPPLSRLLAVAPEASPVTVPSGTGSASAMKTCNAYLNEMNQTVLNKLAVNLLRGYPRDSQCVVFSFSTSSYSLF